MNQKKAKVITLKTMTHGVSCVFVATVSPSMTPDQLNVWFGIPGKIFVVEMSEVMPLPFAKELARRQRAIHNIKSFIAFDGESINYGSVS